MRNFITCFFILLFTLVLTAVPGFGVDMDKLPDQARLSADRMRFDSNTGDFIAVGNVIIQSDGLNVYAPRGTGNIKRKVVSFTDGILASGDWDGEWVNFKGGTIELSFAEPFSYTVDKGIKGEIGKIRIDADKLSLIGTKLTASKVKNLEDRDAGISFGANSVSGTLVDGVITEMTAKTNVWVKGRPNKGGDMVDIRGDTAVYSVERGSVVLTGNVKAVQKGRTLTSKSVVYFPANNRIEAIGGIGEATDGKPLSEDRAVITIDLKQEKQRKNN